MRPSERNRHTYRNCKECASTHREHFALKLSNSEITQKPTERQPAVAAAEPEDVVAEEGDVAAAEPEILVLQQPRCQTANKAKLRETRKKTISDREYLKRENKDGELIAFYSTNMTIRKWDHVRRKNYGKYVANKIRRHISPLHRYQLNEQKAVAVLGDNKALGSRMTGRWAALAREVNLTNGAGKSADSFNAAQVKTELY